MICTYVDGFVEEYHAGVAIYSKVHSIFGPSRRQAVVDDGVVAVVDVRGRHPHHLPSQGQILRHRLGVRLRDHRQKSKQLYSTTFRLSLRFASKLLFSKPGFVNPPSFLFLSSNTNLRSACVQKDRKLNKRRWNKRRYERQRLDQKFHKRQMHVRVRVWCLVPDTNRSFTRSFI